MDNKTNDERLKILQERLSQLKQKKENPIASPEPKVEEIKQEDSHQVKETIEGKEPKWGLEKEEENKKKSYTKKYFILLICGGLIFYAYNNMDSLFSATEVVSEEETPFTLKYNFEIEGNQLAIVNSFKDKSSAKAMVNDLTIKGFKCDYFFLPNKSNSTEEVYKVFIGPYENLEEVNQWKQNVNGEVEILNL